MNPKIFSCSCYFLRKVDNPYYISIDIPENEEENGIASSNLLKATADILDMADICASGTVLSLDLAQRAELEDVNSASDETLQKDEVRLNTVLLSQVHTIKDTIELALKTSQEKLTVVDESEVEGLVEESKKKKHYIKVHNELVSDHGNNPALMSVAFPCLFPLGVTAKDVGTTGSPNSLQIRTLFLSKERGFANNRQFVVDQRRRNEVKRSVGLRINTKVDSTAQIIELVNSEGFAEKLAAAIKDSACSQAMEMKKNLLPLVQIVGHNFKESSIERKGTLGMLYALYHFFSLPFIFSTISP